VRRVANWACKSNSEMTLVVAFQPTLGGDEGKIEVGGDDLRTTLNQVRDCIGRGGPVDGERLRGVG
jgi:hypothetical protein